MGRKALHHTAKHDDVSKYLKKRNSKSKSVRNKLNKYALRNCLVLLKDLKNENIFQLRRDLVDINYGKRETLIDKFTKHRFKKEFKVIINISEAVKIVKETFDNVDISKIRYEDVYNKVCSYESEKLSNFLNNYLLEKMKTVFDSIPLKELHRDEFRYLDKSLDKLVYDYIKQRVTSNLKEKNVLDLLVEDFFTSVHPSFHDRILKDLAEIYIYNRLKDYCEEKRVGVLICNSFDKKVLRNGLKITELASGCFFVDPNILGNKPLCKKMTQAYMNRKVKFLIKENLEAKRLCKKEKVKYDMRKTKCIVIKKRKSTCSRIAPEKESGKVASLDFDRPISTNNEMTKNVFIKKKRKYNRDSPKQSTFVSDESYIMKTKQNCTTASPDSETKRPIAMSIYKRKTPISSPASENVVTSAAAIDVKNEPNTANIECIDLTLSPTHEPAFLDSFAYASGNNDDFGSTEESPHTDKFMEILPHTSFPREEAVAKLKKCLDPKEGGVVLDFIDLTIGEENVLDFIDLTIGEEDAPSISESEHDNHLILENFSEEDRTKFCKAVAVLKESVNKCYENSKKVCINTLLSGVFNLNEYKNSDEKFDVEERDAMVITEREKENSMDIDETGNELEFKRNAIMVSEKEFDQILNNDKKLQSEDVLKNKKRMIENIKKTIDPEEKIYDPSECVVILELRRSKRKVSGKKNELVLKEFENEGDKEMLEKWCRFVGIGKGWIFDVKTENDETENCENTEISSYFDELSKRAVNDGGYVIAAPRNY